MGRPTDYTDDLALEICTRLSDGESLRAITRDDGMPHLSTVLRWLGHADRQWFRDQYAHAREVQAESMFEELFEVADNGANDWMEANDPDNPGYRLNGESIQRSRLRVDTRKWALARMSPKKYGERVTQELVGKDGGPIKTETNLSALPTEDLKQLQKILAKAKVSTDSE